MPGTRYEVRIPPWARGVFGDKLRMSRRFTDDAVGQAWVRKIQSQLASLKAGAEAVSIGIEKSKDLTLKSGAGFWIAEADVRPTTLSWYRMILKAHVLPILGGTRISRIDRACILDYFDKRRRLGASQDSLKRDLTIIRAIMNWARGRGYKTDSSA